MQVADTFTCDFSGSYPLNQESTEAIREDRVLNASPPLSGPSQPVSTQAVEPIERESDCGERDKTADLGKTETKNSESGLAGSHAKSATKFEQDSEQIQIQRLNLEKVTQERLQVPPKTSHKGRRQHRFRTPAPTAQDAAWAKRSVPQADTQTIRLLNPRALQKAPGFSTLSKGKHGQPEPRLRVTDLRARSQLREVPRKGKRSLRSRLGSIDADEASESRRRQRASTALDASQQDEQGGAQSLATQKYKAPASLHDHWPVAVQAASSQPQREVQLAAHLQNRASATNGHLEGLAQKRAASRGLRARESRDAGKANQDLLPALSQDQQRADPRPRLPSR